MKLISRRSDGKKETVPMQYVCLHNNIKLISEMLMTWNIDSDTVGIISSMEKTWISVIAWTTVTLRWSHVIHTFNLHEFNHMCSPEKRNNKKCNSVGGSALSKINPWLYLSSACIIMGIFVLHDPKMQVSYFIWCITQETMTCCNAVGKTGFVWAYWEWYVGVKCVVQILPQHLCAYIFQGIWQVLGRTNHLLDMNGLHRKSHIQLLQVVFSLWSVLKLCKKDT